MRNDPYYRDKEDKRAAVMREGGTVGDYVRVVDDSPPRGDEPVRINQAQDFVNQMTVSAKKFIAEQQEHIAKLEEELEYRQRQRRIVVNFLSENILEMDERMPDNG